jgi:hypothetical protein
VALAIALGHEPPHHDDPPEGPDSFLADHGFEYIDGERTRYPEKMASASEENGEDNDDEDDVQGLSRVVDALSTIMWPTMVRKQANNITSGKRANELRPSLFDFDDDDDDNILLADDDEEATLAALMEADAVDQGAPQTRASRMRREMQALERWLVENEELHEREFGGADGVDDGDDGDEDHDEDRDYEHGGSGGDPPPPPSVRVSASAVPGVHTAPVDDPWATSTTSNPTSTSTQTPTHSAALASHSISITNPRSSGFDDDFSAFVSAPAAPAAVSIAGDTAATAKITPASTTASASEPIADARRLYTHTQLLLPSHTGDSIRSIRSVMSDLSISDTGDGHDLCVGGGYEALDDISNGSLNFSPEHGDVDVDDGDPRPSISGQRSGDRAASLGDVPFNLPNILNALQTIREDVAGIEDEAERRATTARFASEFVYKRMGVDDGDGKETDG